MDTSFLIRVIPVFITVLWFSLVSNYQIAYSGPPSLETLSSQVGNLGDTSTLEFSGNNNFSQTSIIAGLNLSPDFLSASHPLAPLDEYLRIVKECIVRGYHNSGYPDAEVFVIHDESKKIVRISIEEGHRYKKGEIRVIGNQIVPTKAIITKLTQPNLPEATEFQVAGKRLAGSGEFSIERAQRDLTKPKLGFIDQKEMVDIELIDAIEDALRLVPIIQSKEERKASEEEDAQDTSNSQHQDNLSSDDSKSNFDLFFHEGPNPCPLWDYSQNFARFYVGLLPEIERSVKNLLAGYGFPLAKVSADFDIDSSLYTVHLILHMEEGPPATIGRINIVGNEIITDDEIIEWAGLHQGLRLTPNIIQNAKIALWNSARFANFDIDVKVIDQKGDDYEIEIDVLESKHLPDDMTSVEPAMKRSISALANLANWFTTEALKEGLTVRVGIPGAPEWTIVVSNEKGLALFVGESLEASKLALSAQNSLFRFYARDGENISLYTGDLSVGSLAVTSYAFANNFSILTSASTKANSCDVRNENRGVVKIANIVSPEVLLSSFDFFKEFEQEFKAEEVSLIDPSNNVEIIRFNENTGRLISLDLKNIQALDIIPESRIEVKAGADDIDKISRFIDQFNESDLAANLNHVSYADIASEPYIKGLLGSLSNYSDKINLEDFLADLPVAFKIFERSFPIIKDLLVDLFYNKEIIFSIPRSQNTIWQPSVTATILGPLIFSFANTLGPPDNWPSLLAHEIYYILNGQKKYTHEVIQQLYDDPQMGPLGSTITAYIIKKTDPMIAWKFAARSVEYNSLEKFRADCQLFLDPKTQIGQYIEKLLLRFSELDDNYISQLVARLDITEAELVRNLLKSIQKNPDKDIGRLAQSQLDKWWEISISSNLTKRVGRLISGQIEFNSNEYAALVNGIPVNRKLIKMKQFKPHLFVNIPDELFGTLDSSDEAFESLVIQTLVLQNALDLGYDLSDGIINKFIEKDYQSQSGVSREQYEQAINDMGLTYSEFRDLFRLNIIYNEMLKVKMKDITPPSDAEIKDAVEGFIRANELRHIKAIIVSDNSRQRMDKVLKEVVDKGGFAAVYNRYALNDTGDVQVADFLKVKKSDLNKDLADHAFSLKAGEVSDVIESGTNLFILYNVGPESEEMHNLLKKELSETLNQSKRKKAILDYLSNLRSIAFIEMLE